MTPRPTGMPSHAPVPQTASVFIASLFDVGIDTVFIRLGVDKLQWVGTCQVLVPFFPNSLVDKTLDALVSTHGEMETALRTGFEAFFDQAFEDGFADFCTAPIIHQGFSWDLYRHVHTVTDRAP